MTISLHIPACYTTHTHIYRTIASPPLEFLSIIAPNKSYIMRVCVSSRVHRYIYSLCDSRVANHRIRAHRFLSTTYHFGFRARAHLWYGHPIRTVLKSRHDPHAWHPGPRKECRISHHLPMPPHIYIYGTWITHHRYLSVASCGVFFLIHADF